MDANIITILISAFGGALVSSLTGFLTIYIDNKHSFRMAKEKDNYEYGQYTNRMLCKYLEELERESQLVTHENPQETLIGAYAGSTGQTPPAPTRRGKPQTQDRVAAFLRNVAMKAGERWRANLLQPTHSTRSGAGLVWTMKHCGCSKVISFATLAQGI